MKHISTLSFICILAILFSCIYTSRVHAQFNTPLPTSVGVTLSPEVPGPNQSVTATADSYSTDLNQAKITWKINGKIQASAIGLKTFTFNTGAVNTLTTLDVIVVTNQGETITQSFPLKPVSIDLIWQTVGFTPPFYKGKTLFSHQNLIQFVVVPHILGNNGIEIPAKNLIYTWTKNGSVLSDYSGYGKSTYTMLASVISRPITMGVSVTSTNTNGTGRAQIVVEPVEPTVVLYDKDPLYGIEFEHALTGTVQLNNSKEMTVVAMPYFFGTENPTDTDLAYTWSINNTLIDSDTTQTERVFRQKEGTSGASFISLSVSDASKILQFGSAGFNLNFVTPKTAKAAL